MEDSDSDVHEFEVSDDSDEQDHREREADLHSTLNSAAYSNIPVREKLRRIQEAADYAQDEVDAARILYRKYYERYKNAFKPLRELKEIRSTVLRMEGERTIVSDDAQKRKPDSNNAPVPMHTLSHT